MNKKRCHKRSAHKPSKCLSCTPSKGSESIVSNNQYFAEGTIKKIDIENEKINIISEVTVSDDSEKKYNVWIKENESELLKKAILLKSDVEISYFCAKEEIKSTLIQIALENKKAKFYISKNDKADYKLCNLVISNEK